MKSGIGKKVREWPTIVDITDVKGAEKEQNMEVNKSKTISQKMILKTKLWN